MLHGFHSSRFSGIELWTMSGWRSNTQPSYMSPPFSCSVLPRLFCPSLSVNPYFLEPQPNQQFTYNETDNVTFTCTAVGLPAPDILFFRNTLRLNRPGAQPPNPRVILENATSPVRNNASGEFLLEVSRTLIITDTEDGDSGSYNCQTVSDPRLEVNTVTFELLVQGQYTYSRQLPDVPVVHAEQNQVHFPTALSLDLHVLCCVLVEAVLQYLAHV